MVHKKLNNRFFCFEFFADIDFFFFGFGFLIFWALLQKLTPFRNQSGSKKLLKKYDTKWQVHVQVIV